ncbi:MAG: ROK family protein [Pontiellaceae bacterium]|nr:ROK family protein [Pontiellaceae bacterium]
MNKKRQPLIGIDLGGTNLRVGLIKDNKIIKISTEKVTKTGSAEDIYNGMVRMIESIIDSHTAGMGIGVPGLVEEGVVYDLANIPQWKEMPLKHLLESRFNIPVYINNDANCFAAGEKYYGHGKKAGSVIGLIIGTGMGAGVIINNKLYEGRNCGAGEFGCIPYLDHNYEYYCSGQFFANKYKTTAHDAERQACHGNKEALRIYREFGAHLGMAIQTVLYSYDPELIVLGGSVSKAFALFKDSMYEALTGFVFKKTIQNIKIEVSEIQDIAIYGAASLYYDSLIKGLPRGTGAATKV